MNSQNKQIFPVRWRAQTNKDNIVLLRIYDKENKIYDVNFPLQQIIQINKILKEIIGYSEKNFFFETEWNNVVYKFDLKDTDIKLFSDDQKHKFSINLKNAAGIDINFEIDSQSLKKFSEKINETIG